MGIGFVLAVNPANVRTAIEFLDSAGFPAWEIGKVEKAAAEQAPSSDSKLQAAKGGVRFV